MIILTDREFETLSLMAKGLNDKEIADKMCVSINTVKTYIGFIYSKMTLFKKDEKNFIAAMRVKAVLKFLKGEVRKKNYF